MLDRRPGSCRHIKQQPFGRKSALSLFLSNPAPSAVTELQLHTDCSRQAGGRPGRGEQGEGKVVSQRGWTERRDNSWGEQPSI